MADRTAPLRETDDAARDTARKLLASAQTAALAVVEPGTGAPFVSRIAFGLGPGGEPVTLVSDLALHTQALRQDPRASLLIGEPGTKGDPLTHPRLTLRATARFIDRDDPAHPDIRTAWLAHKPKAGLYVDFADFQFVVFGIIDGHLNAGFGKAYALDRKDFRLD